jgi:hypothetical protein
MVGRHIAEAAGTPSSPVVAPDEMSLTDGHMPTHQSQVPSRLLVLDSVGVLDVAKGDRGDPRRRGQRLPVVVGAYAIAFAALTLMASRLVAVGHV